MAAATIERVFVDNVFEYAPRSGRGETRFEVWCRRPDALLATLVIDLFEPKACCLKASLCQQAKSAGVPVIVTYVETARGFLRLTHVRLAERSHAA